MAITEVSAMLVQLTLTITVRSRWPIEHCFVSKHSSNMEVGRYRKARFRHRQRLMENKINESAGVCNS